jgi:hypothetical protein
LPWRPTKFQLRFAGVRVKTSDHRWPPATVCLDCFLGGPNMPSNSV